MKNIVKYISIFMTGTFILMSGCGNTNDAVADASLAKLGIKENQIIKSDKDKIEDTNYILETNYKGNNMPVELYDTEFKKSKYYISNKEFLEVLNKKKTNAQKYIDSAKDFTSTIFGNNYNDILADQDTFSESLDGFLVGSEYFESEKSDLADNIMQAYVDNKLEMTAVFETDESLIYNDVLYYIRGVVEITKRGGNAKDYEKVFGIKTAKDETVKLMVEYSFEPGNPQGIVGINVMGYIE